MGTTEVEDVTMDVSAEYTVLAAANDADDCHDKCLQSEECLAFTFYPLLKPFPICYMFKAIGSPKACPSVGNSSCTTASVTRIKTGKKCDPNYEEDTLITELPAENSIDCSNLCSILQECEWFVFFNENAEFSCRLYTRKCAQTAKCPNCESGDLQCLTPEQCRHYVVLDDPSRSVTNQSFAGLYDYGDFTQNKNTSPDWKGENWYRMVEPAGMYIPESPPGNFRCHTFGAGWMRGQHTTVVGDTKTVEVCFDCSSGLQCDTGGEKTDCAYPTNIEVTKCNGFYTYYLPEVTPNGFRRYCSTNSTMQF